MARRNPTNRQRGDLTNVYPYVQCKALQHRWEAVGPVPNAPRRRSSFGTSVTMQCEHCTTYRFDVFSRLTGDLLSRSYQHPDEYKTQVLTKKQWRVMWMDELPNNLLEGDGA